MGTTTRRRASNTSARRRGAPVVHATAAGDEVFVERAIAYAGGAAAWRTLPRDAQEDLVALLREHPDEWRRFERGAARDRAWDARRRDYVEDSQRVALPKPGGPRVSPL